MRLAAIYRNQEDYTTTVEEFLRDFSVRAGRSMDVIDPDSRQGAAFCETYDIVEYPTIVALSDDGSVQYMWRGLPLPTTNEVAYYL
jgi:hypothetical protein